MSNASGPRGAEPRGADLRDPDPRDPDRTGTAGMRVVFTVCLGVIVIGLAIMLVLPLAGR